MSSIQKLSTSFLSTEQSGRLKAWVTSLNTMDSTNVNCVRVSFGSFSDNKKHYSSLYSNISLLSVCDAETHVRGMITKLLSGSTKRSLYQPDNNLNGRFLATEKLKEQGEHPPRAPLNQNVTTHPEPLYPPVRLLTYRSVGPIQLVSVLSISRRIRSCSAAVSALAIFHVLATRSRK